MFYLVATPWWIKKILYPSYTWDIPSAGKKIYLSFDDGPHPVYTPAILDLLAQHQAKATFFCIGKNVVAHPQIYERILAEGHQTGNHTFNHVNGWHTDDKTYFEEVQQTARFVDSKLFRPPYGRITRFQAKQLMSKMGYKIIMWSVLSGDFDTTLKPDDCWKNVRKTAKSGAVIVFHDSEKAGSNMLYTVEKTLEYFKKEGFSFERIEVKENAAPGSL